MCSLKNTTSLAYMGDYAMKRTSNCSLTMIQYIHWFISCLTSSLFFCSQKALSQNLSSLANRQNLNENLLRVHFRGTRLESEWNGPDSTPGGPFLESPGNLTGPKSYLKIKVSNWKVGCVLTSNEVYFVSLAENFTVQFLNLLKLPSGMENKTA